MQRDNPSGSLHNNETIQKHEKEQMDRTWKNEGEMQHPCATPTCVFLRYVCYVIRVTSTPLSPGIPEFRKPRPLLPQVSKLTTCSWH